MTTEKIKELMETFSEELINEDLLQIEKEIKEYNQKYVDHSSKEEMFIYEEMIKGLSNLSKETKGLYSQINEDLYPKVEFTAYIPFKNEQGFVVQKRFDTIKIFKVYPERPEKIKNEKIDITTCDFGLDYNQYSDYENTYPRRETKESLLKKLEEKEYISSREEIEFEIHSFEGHFYDRNTSYGTNDAKYSLKSSIFLEFLEALNLTEAISVLKDINSKKDNYIMSFEGKVLFSDISVALNQINEIIKEEKIDRDYPFSFNDLDNSVYFLTQREDYSVFIITEQNANFAIFFKDIENYRVYQIATDLSYKEVSENFVNRNAHYFEQECFLYTNKNSYDNYISEEFILASSLDEIFEKECFLLDVVKGERKENKGFLTNFVFDVIHTQNALAEEFDRKIEETNIYSGEPEMLYAEMYSKYGDTLYSSKIPMIDQLFFTNGNGYEWHEDGYITTYGRFNLSYEESLKITIPEGEIPKKIYPLCQYAMVVNFPDNITDVWFEELKKAIEIVFEAGTDKDKKFLIEELSKREKTKEIIKEYK